jgi:hypothetical protein
MSPKQVRAHQNTILTRYFERQPDGSWEHPPERSQDERQQVEEILRLHTHPEVLARRTAL